MSRVKGSGLGFSPLAGHIPGHALTVCCMQANLAPFPPQPPAGSPAGAPYPHHPPAGAFFPSHRPAGASVLAPYQKKPVAQASTLAASQWQHAAAALIPVLALDALRCWLQPV